MPRLFINYSAAIRYAVKTGLTITVLSDGGYLVS